MQIRVHLKNNGTGAHSLRLKTVDAQFYRVEDTDLPQDQAAAGDMAFNSSVLIGAVPMIYTQRGDLRGMSRPIVRIDLIEA